MKYLFLSVILSSLLVTIATPSPANAEGNTAPGRPFLQLLIMVKSLQNQVAEHAKENSDLQTAQDNETAVRTAGDNSLQSNVASPVSDSAIVSTVSGASGTEASGYGSSTLEGYHQVTSTNHETIPAIP